MTTTGSITKALVEVFQGDSLTDLALVAYGGFDLNILPAQAGQTYHIAVSTRETPGPVTIELSIPPPPINDHFTNALVLSGNHLDGTGDLLNASREAGEPEHGSATVWYSWVAPAAGGAAFSVPHGLVTGIYTGDTVSTLHPVLRLITFDNLSLWVTFSNTVYYIAVASSSPTLSFDFKFDFPRHRGFEERQLLTGTDIQVNAAAGGWWTWQAPASGRAQLSLIHSDIQPVDFAVYSGDSGHHLRSIIASPEPSFAAVAGRWYHFQVTATTNLTFQLNLSSPVPSLDAIHHTPSSFTFDLRGTPGDTFQLETSTDLIDWQSLGLHIFYGPAYPFTDPQANDPMRFYRAGPVR